MKFYSGSIRDVDGFDSKLGWLVVVTYNENVINNFIHAFDAIKGLEFFGVKR